jgi:AbrB family looped-hinge helix DNA binding protein
VFPQMKFWGAATVGSKGQVVIPAEAREELNIKEGDKLVVMGPPTKNGIMFIKADSIEAMMQHIQKDFLAMQESVKKSEDKTL